MDHVAATEIRIATPDDDVRFDTFMRSFLSDNGFPFIMVRSDPDLTGGGAALKHVMFEDDAVTRRFSRQWRALARAKTRGAA